MKIIEGRPRGATIRLSGPSFLVGNAPDCQLRPRDSSVADRHCEFLIGDGYLALRDLGSAEGTLLNGLRIVPDCTARARPGDRIRIGDSVFEVCPGEDPSPAEGDSTPAAAASLVRRRLGGRGAAGSGRGLLRTGAVEGIPVHSVLLGRVAAPAEVAAWRGVLSDLADRPCPGRLVLDLRAVAELSIEAAEVLLAFRERLGRRGATLKLCEVAGPVLRSLEQAGVAALIPVALDAPGAVWSTW